MAKVGKEKGHEKYLAEVPHPSSVGPSYLPSKPDQLHPR